MLSDVNWIWATFLKKLQHFKWTLGNCMDRRCSKIYLNLRCGLKVKTGPCFFVTIFFTLKITHNILVTLQLFWNVHFLFPSSTFSGTKTFDLLSQRGSQQGFLREIWEAVTLISYIGQYLLWTAPQLTRISSWLHFTQQGPFPLTQVCKYTLTAFNYTLIISKRRTICRHDHINPVAK